MLAQAEQRNAKDASSHRVIPSEQHVRNCWAELGTVSSYTSHLLPILGSETGMLSAETFKEMGKLEWNKEGAQQGCVRAALQ